MNGFPQHRCLRRGCPDVTLEKLQGTTGEQTVTGQVESRTNKRPTPSWRPHSSAVAVTPRGPLVTGDPGTVDGFPPKLATEHVHFPVFPNPLKCQYIHTGCSPFRRGLLSFQGSRGEFLGTLVLKWNTSPGPQGRAWKTVFPAEFSKTSRGGWKDRAWARSLIRAEPACATCDGTDVATLRTGGFSEETPPWASGTEKQGLVTAEVSCLHLPHSSWSHSWLDPNVFQPGKQEFGLSQLPALSKLGSCLQM